MKILFKYIIANMSSFVLGILLIYLEKLVKVICN